MKYHFNDKGIRIYRVQGNYPTRKAIKLHPDLLDHLKTRHPPRIRKSDPRTLLIYNRYIAKDLYDLDVEFYPGAIIPTPILRYNFLSHVIQPKSTILEIGTGACAIIAMLAAKKFGCQVVATELDPNYVTWAEETIKNNQLEDQIKLIRSEGPIIKNLFPSNFQVDYIISNPPYYDEILSPKNPWGGRDHELISEGEHGEQFILRFIEEGWAHLKPKGILSFIVPKTRRNTLWAVEKYLNTCQPDKPYDIIGLQAGNRIRYIFRVIKPPTQIRYPSSEIE